MSESKKFKFNEGLVVDELCETLNIPREFIQVFALTNEPVKKHGKTRGGFLLPISDKQNNILRCQIHFQVQLDVKTQLMMLCHEMIHAYQYYYGDLTSKGFRRYWKGEIVDFPCENYEQYMALPWEQEAYGNAPTLYNEVFGDKYE